MNNIVDISAQLASIAEQKRALDDKAYDVISQILEYKFKSGKFKDKTIQEVIASGNSKYVEYMIKNGYIPFKINMIDWIKVQDSAKMRTRFDEMNQEIERERKITANMTERELQQYRLAQEIRNNRNLRDWGM